MCAARQKQIKSPVQEVLPESKDSIAHPLVVVILAARVNNTKPETKSNKEGNNARPVAAMLATQVEEAVASPNSKSHDDVANPLAALCPRRIRPNRQLKQLVPCRIVSSSLKIKVSLR